MDKQDNDTNDSGAKVLAVSNGSLYKVTGDHDILRRPDKYGLTFKEAIAYADKLKSFRYRNLLIEEIENVEESDGE